MQSKRAKRPSMKLYMMMYAFLYGGFKWFDRHPDGSITIPVNMMGKHFKIHPTALREELEKLHRIGGLVEFEWRSHWFRVKPAVPTGMARHIEPSLEVGEVLDV